MSGLSRFLKENKAGRQVAVFAPTKSLVDEAGEPLLWTIRPLSTKEHERIRDDCSMEVAVRGKSNVFRTKTNGAQYMAMMICAAVVEPNLNSAELQDSYGVKSAVDLLKEMVDDPGEYSRLAAFVQKQNGFDNPMEDLVEQAKN